MSARAWVAILALGLVVATPVSASDVGYLYGRVVMKSGDVYQGQLRWGNEESFWDDIFNASKLENDNLQYLDRKDRDRVRSHESHGLSFLGIGEDWGLTDHVFAVRFGDLKRIEVHGGDDVVVEFRDGEQMELGGGSNDVGATITVVDGKSGIRLIKWNRIDRIEFMNTPAMLPAKMGEPIYGTVTTEQGQFTGRVQWDNDETLTTDELDGDTDDGDDVSLEFGEIAGIRKYRSGAQVKLRNGDQLYLRGSNDVNHGNRGVVVNVPGVGTVKVGWDDFEELRLTPAPTSGRSYADYAKASDLKGQVVTQDGSLSGRIVFDLDESRDVELLQGKDGDTEYLIPFRDIARIKPLGRSRSRVELRSGQTITLEDGQDVSRKNDGLLVFTGSSKPKYVAWKDVSDVTLE